MRLMFVHAIIVQEACVGTKWNEIEVLVTCYLEDEGEDSFSLICTFNWVGTEEVQVAMLVA